MQSKEARTSAIHRHQIICFHLSTVVKSFRSPLFASRSEGTRTCFHLHLLGWKAKFVDNGQGGRGFFETPNFARWLPIPFRGKRDRPLDNSFERGDHYEGGSLKQSGGFG